MRFGLLAFLILSIASIAGLLYFGRSGSGAPGAATTAGQPTLDEETVLSSQDLGYEVYAGDRLAFRIQAKESRADRDGNSYLEDVDIETFRGDTSYRIRGHKARYNPETNQALIEGEVLVKGPDNVTIETDWLDLRDRGNLLVASKGTRFRSGNEMLGTARNLRMYIQEERLLLGGGVRMRSGPGALSPFSLRARNMRYDRVDSFIRAEGEVKLERGEDSLEAKRINIRLDPLTDAPLAVRAMWNVRGSVAAEDEDGDLGPQRVSFSGWSLAAAFEEETELITDIQLDGRDGREARIAARDQEGSVRTLESIAISGVFDGGFLQEATADGNVRLLNDGVAGERSASAVAQKATALFDRTGAIVRLDLEGAVELVQAEFNARGSRAWMNFTNRRSGLMGEPVDVRAPQGTLRAPRVTHAGDSGLLHATGGVRTVLDESSSTRLVGMPFGEPDGGPVRVESEEAFLRPAPADDFIFRGGVRAWQGRNHIRSNQLRGSQASGELAASGEVHTRFYPSAGSESPIPGREGGDATVAANGEEAPVDVRSKHMSYSERLGTVIYSGGVDALQAGRSMACREMRLDLDDQGEADTMLCSGEAKLVDPDRGRTIAGARAIYHLTLEEIEFYGDPLEIVDPEQGKVTGAELRYRLADGRMRIGPNAAEEPIGPLEAPTDTTAEAPQATVEFATDVSSGAREDR